MTEINMLEAKTNLTKMIRLLESKQEDEFVICRHGKPCAKLIFYDNNDNKRIVGKFDYKLKNYSNIDIDFLNNEIEKDFEEELNRKDKDGLY